MLQNIRKNYNSAQLCGHHISLGGPREPKICHFHFPVIGSFSHEDVKGFEISVYDDRFH